MNFVGHGKNEATTMNELAKKITLLDAFDLLAMPWNEISENTVKNSFKRIEFIKDGLVVEQGFIQSPDMRTEMGI